MPAKLKTYNMDTMTILGSITYSIDRSSTAAFAGRMVAAAQDSSALTAHTEDWNFILMIREKEKHNVSERRHAVEKNISAQRPVRQTLREAGVPRVLQGLQQNMRPQNR